MGNAQDSAALNAMRGTLLGLQGKELAAKVGLYNNASQPLPPMYDNGVAAPATGAAAPATGGSGGLLSSPAPNAKVSDGGIGAGPLYGYLTSIGASPNEAALLTSGANIESGFKPDTTHDADILAARGLPPGYGLWGDNADRLANMRTSAGVGPTANVPWQDQAKFQLAELRDQMGDRVNAAKTPEQLTALQLEYLRPKGWNTGGGMASERLAATREYMANPPGAKPTQVAQADTGTATDAVPGGSLLDYGARPAGAGPIPPQIPRNSQGQPYTPLGPNDSVAAARLGAARS
jgi:hypothetical protein